MDKKLNKQIFDKYIDTLKPTNSLQIKFKQWFLTALNENEREEELSSLWKKSETEETSIFTHNEWDKLLHNIDEKQSKRILLNDGVKRFMRIAAFIAVPIMIVTLINYFIPDKDFSDNYKLSECFVPSGDKKEMILPDGTTVWINSGTILIYPESFLGNERSIYLVGEARFDVVKNPDKPFRVKTPHITVEALGTIFNVSSYTNEAITTATLEEGKIKVLINNKTDQDFILVPNQQIAYDNITGNINQSEVEAENIGNWRSGDLYFKGTPISQVFNTLERHFNIEIQYNRAKYERQSLTVKFDSNETIEDVLSVLTVLIPGMKYKMFNNLIEIQ